MRMTKVYPNAPAVEAPSQLVLTAKDGKKEEVLTVWRKSLLFNCEGFTVFDGKGDLRFRVDCYSAGRKGEIVLMDAAGKSLVTVRRKVNFFNSFLNLKFCFFFILGILFKVLIFLTFDPFRYDFRISFGKRVYCYC